MVFKIVTGVMDSKVSCSFIGIHSVTRGHRYKLTQKHVHYNLTKFSFANRVVFIWNSLPLCSLYAQLKFLKIVWLIFERLMSACVSGRPVCLESEAKVLFKVNCVFKVN